MVMSNSSKWITAFAVVYLVAFLYNLNSHNLKLIAYQQVQIPLESFLSINNGSQISFYHQLIKNEPLILKITYANGTKQEYNSYGQHSRFQMSLPSNKASITEAVLYVGEEVEKIDELERRRMLLTTPTTSNTFLYYSLIGFQTLLSVSRNLLILGVITNMNDIFLPYIVLCECFVMLGFWPGKMHLLSSLFYNVFNSKLDILNMVRLIMSTPSQSNKIPQFFQYKFGDLHCINLSGQILLASLLLLFTIFVKLNPICIKSEKMRKITKRLRSIWNGYFVAVLPRLATYTAFHWRLLGTSNFDMLNIISCSLISIALIAFFVALIVQIRRINSKKEFLDTTRYQIGLTGRFNYTKDFQFDCLQFSMLYYPLVNYFRLLIFFLPLGLSYSSYYYLYAGTIVSQMFAIMIEVSSSSYTNRRDKILFPIHNFFFLLMQLSIITIHITENISNSMVSEIVESILFALFIFIVITSLGGIVLDIKQHCSENKALPSKELQDNIQNDEIINTNYDKQITMQKKKEVKPKAKAVNRDSNNDDDKENKEDVTQKKIAPNVVPMMKINKLYKGKVI